jgi:hypothetical protein
MFHNLFLFENFKLHVAQKLKNSIVKSGRHRLSFLPEIITDMLLMELIASIS